MKAKPLTLLAMVLCSYLSADDNTSPMVPQTEFEQLAVIMAKYGNNAEGILAINYALLQKDEAAVDLLLKYGATFGNKSLYYAIKSGSLELVKKLIDMGVDPKKSEDNNRDSLCSLSLYYILGREDEITRYLMDYMDKSNYLRTIMQEYDSLERAKIIAYLLDHHDIEPNELLDGIPLLYYATQQPQYGSKTLQVLLERGANVNAILDVKMYRNVFGDQLVQQYYTDAQKDMITLLVQYGADISHKDIQGKTPLQRATDPRMIEFLKGLGAK